MNSSYSRGLLFVSLLIPCSVSLHGQEPCDTVSTQTAMNICADRKAARANQRLRSLLADLRASLDSTRFAQLRRVQAQWAAYRAAHCQWEGDAFAGGSVTPMAVSGCFEAVTETRIQQLKIHLCEGEGMTGECPASHRYDRAEVGKRVEPNH